MELTAERVRYLVDYEPETGDLRWRIRPREDFATLRGWKIFLSQRAGKVVESSQKYKLVRLDNVLYQQHRVIWLWVHGAWPTNIIDHANRDTRDNRLMNLREATFTQNHGNRAGRKGKLKGAHYCKQTGLWEARIRKDGKNMFLGRHKSPELANAAYAKAAKELYGEFARA